ncbi:MAG: AmmeMemoRadiSam system protein B [Candidatus Binatia bacterium]
MTPWTRQRKHSDLAGTWYARDESSLGRQVDDLLLTAAPALSPPLRGLIVPHAGYVYSGRAAAAGYARLRSHRYRRAVILAPSHLAAFRGVAVLEVEAFVTPLGAVAVDRQAVETLLHGAPFHRSAEPFYGEHALEIQLPFLQRVLPLAQVVPTLVGSLDRHDLAVAAARLQAVVDGNTVVIVSSDFTHYGRRFAYLPFPAEGAEAVRAGLHDLDMGAIERVCAGDPAAFAQYVTETGATICGHVPIALFLTMHAQRSRGELVTYYTSLDVTGDFQHCVSYASVAFPQLATA